MLPAPVVSSDEAARSFASIIALPGTWIDLTTIEWESATTGWQRLADDSEPRLGQAFPYTPLTAGGQTFTTGIGTYPLSEITYDLAGRYGAFRAGVALDDLSSPEARVTFSVYVDDLLVYRTEPAVFGSEPSSIEAPLYGGDRLRIVVESGRRESKGAYPNWLTPEVFLPAAGPASLSQARASLAETVTHRQHPIRASRGQPLGPRANTSGTTIVLGSDGAVTASFDPTQCLMSLVNASTQVAFGYGGPQHGRLLVGAAAGDAPPFLSAASEVLLGANRLSLAETRPVFDDAWAIQTVSDGAFGDGIELTINLEAPTGDPLHVRIGLFHAHSYVTYQIVPGGKLRPSGYSYFGSDAAVAVGPGGQYLSDRGRIWTGGLPDDGVWRAVPLEPSKPLLLWSDATRQGLILATIDASEAPLQVELTCQPGDEELAVRLNMEFLPAETTSGAALNSPRLWIQPTAVDHVFDAFADYRAMVSRLYPPAPLPDWVRYQWGTWWTYGPSPTDAGVRSQIDAIVRDFSDLGLWHVFIDAAWYVAYGRPTASLLSNDFDKFPDGLRAVTDYAHDRDVRIVLYLPAGFLNGGLPDGGEWQAFQGIIDEEPSWLVPLFKDRGIPAYMLDYSVPGVRTYMEAVVADAILEHGVDGIEIDGLADPEGQITDVRTRDLYGIASPYLPSVQIYKLLADRLFTLRPDAYLEGGWVNPMLAAPYAHVFFMSDEEPTFSNPYPFGGLLQHIDYALFQEAALGQRAKLGTVRGNLADRNTLQWIEAALATDTQIALGFDLTVLEPQQLSALRQRLAHYDPFRGETVTSAARTPNAFATTRDHLSYVAVVNRSSQRRTLETEVWQLGVLAPGLVAYDVESGRWMPAMDIPHIQLTPKSIRLFLVPHQPRVVWSDASWTYEPSDDTHLVVTFNGPDGLIAFPQIWAPGAREVVVDGSPLQRGSVSAPTTYTLNPATGVVSLGLEFGPAHRVEIAW